MNNDEYEPLLPFELLTGFFMATYIILLVAMTDLVLL